VILGKPFFPKPEDNRMGNHGDVASARESYYSRTSRNLSYLLEQRYAWAVPYIDPSDEGVELGCGIGVTKDFVRAKSLLLTDFDDGPWLDVCDVDATATPFADEQFDFVLIQNAIHHLAQPIRLFPEVARILKPGGVLLVRDVKCSLLQRALAHVTKVEGYSYDVDVYDRDAVLSDPANLWEANNAVPDLLFDDLDTFHRQVPEFRVEHQHFDEFLLTVNSGGVTHKTVSIPLPERGLKLLHAIDRRLTGRFPDTFAMQRSLVLRKVA
jgi:SAM-dependent methyltransferase